MVWRRRYQRDTRLRMTQLRNQPRDLVSRQLAAFSRLSALRYLDLDLFSVRQVLGSNTEATRSNLLDLVIERTMYRRRIDEFRNRSDTSLAARRAANVPPSPRSAGVLAAQAGTHPGLRRLHPYWSALQVSSWPA